MESKTKIKIENKTNPSLRSSSASLVGYAKSIEASTSTSSNRSKKSAFKVPEFIDPLPLSLILSELPLEAKINKPLSKNIDEEKSDMSDFRFLFTLFLLVFSNFFVICLTVLGKLK